MADARRLLVLTRDRTGAPFRQRIEPYLAPLAARGIEAEVVELAASPWPRRDQFRRGRGFDGVLVHRKTLTWWDAAALGATRPLLYDFDDAVMYQARSPEVSHAGRERRFLRTIARAALAIAGSPALAAHARTAGAARVEVVPTGLDAAKFAPKPDHQPRGPLRLVWIGSRSTLKQLEPLRPTLAALGRAVPGLVLRIIADAGLEVDGLRVENVAWSLEAEARLLAEADVGIAPLPDTPYTRGKCGFKVLQYMAAGLPVVASPVGVNAEYVRPEITGLHAITTEEWIAAVGRLAGDATLRERMGRAGRERIEREFDFTVLAPTVCRLVEEAIA
ncbi:MAG TPA: glycosyltransferase family 4 protein [Phycisphaerae bacterium]|nr:glycosyltransferase family 4 protein [Phycisphaerae bacterium]